jgi:hypothetical protein
MTINLIKEIKMIKNRLTMLSNKIEKIVFELEGTPKSSSKKPKNPTKKKAIEEKTVSPEAVIIEAVTENMAGDYNT